MKALAITGSVIIITAVALHINGILKGWQAPGIGFGVIALLCLITYIKSRSK